MSTVYTSRRSWIDAVVVIITAVVTAAIVLWSPIFPRIARQFGFQVMHLVDNLLVIALIVMVALVVFAIRRWQETTRESARRQLTEQALHERVKELICLHDLAQIISRPDVTLEEIMAESVGLLPPAWSYPNGASARIVFQGREYTTPNFAETDWMQSADIPYLGEVAGQLTVCYRQAFPAADEGPFLTEERALLETFAERLGRVAEAIQGHTALRDSESRYQALFESMADAVFIHDQQGTIIEVNRAACQRLGYTRDELLSLRLEDIDPDFVRRAPELRAASQVTDHLVFETTQVARDGHPVPSEMGGRAIEYNGQQAILTISRDITERKEAERAAAEYTLQLSIRNRIANAFLTSDDTRLYDNVLREILDILASPVGIFGYINADGNLACPSLTGEVWQHCEMSDKMSVFPPDAWGGIWKRVMVEGKGLFRNGDLHVPDGHIQMERALAVPIRFHNATIGLLMVANKAEDYTADDLSVLETIAAYVSPILEARLRRDELERQRESAVAELEASEAKYRLLINTAADGILVIDQKGVIILCNQSVAQALGYAENDLMGRRISDLLGEQAEELMAHLESVFGAGEDQLFEEQVIIGGTPHWYGFNVQPLPTGDDACPAAQIIAREITEQKRTERQLRHYAEELEKRNDDIRNFAYIVSHDLRAPLVNLKGFSAELRAAVNEVKPIVIDLLPTLAEDDRQRVQLAIQEDVPEALEFIEHSVTRMDKFLSAVLQLSRFGRRELNFEPVDVNAVASDVLESLKHQIERQGIVVNLDPLPTVVADRTSIEQILNNLLSNAVKYLAPERPGRIDIYAEETVDETTIFVRDNGRGIAAEDFDKVLMPFRRTGKQDVPGEGVGLSYADTLVRRHNGSLDFESELDVGSTFSFSIAKHLGEE